MKPSEPFIHDWMDARVEVYLDEALPADEQARFEHALAADADWEAELFLARQIRDGLHVLPQPVCPPRVADGAQYPAAVTAPARQVRPACLSPSPGQCSVR